MTTRSINGSGGPAGNASPMPVIYALSFMLSVGTGIVTSGVYFLTTQAYEFSTRQNYALGLFQGLTYVAAAMVAGRIVRLVRRKTGLSSRAILACIIGGLGVLCFIPLAAVGRGGGGGGTPSAWPIWVMVLLYSPLTGFLWPLVENYVSGGRSGTKLRRALGSWNLWWSSALVVSFFLMGPLIGRGGGTTGKEATGAVSTQQLIAVLGAIHLLTMFVLLRLRPEPGMHVHEDHEPHPPVYRELLGTFRILLPTSYFVLTALQPYMPKALASLSVAENWVAPLAAVWLLARFMTFFVLDRWHGWHGRWTLAVVSIALLIAGFAATVLGPQLGHKPAAIAVCIVGLFGFGIGMATTYTAALYYVMAVGQSDIDAGGSHESLIGLGYAAGPAAGLLAASWTGGTGDGARFELSVVTLVGVIAVVAFVVAAWLTHHHTRR